MKKRMATLVRMPIGVHPATDISSFDGGVTYPLRSRSFFVLIMSLLSAHILWCFIPCGSLEVQTFCVPSSIYPSSRYIYAPSKHILFQSYLLCACKLAISTAASHRVYQYLQSTMANILPVCFSIIGFSFPSSSFPVVRMNCLIIDSISIPVDPSIRYLYSLPLFCLRSLNRGVEDLDAARQVVLGQLSNGTLFQWRDR